VRNPLGEDNGATCILCGGAASCTQPALDRKLYVYSCARCGKYQTGHMGAVLWPGVTGEAERRAQIERVREANRRGETPFI